MGDNKAVLQRPSLPNMMQKTANELRGGEGAKRGLKGANQANLATGRMRVTG
ncbi:MAG: hypothetical protein WA996_09090 [Candidatus Promineifilaceae bacterium]